MLKDKNKIIAIFRWLHAFGKQYEDEVMMRDVDFSRLLKGNDYARANFIRNYAYARANAPLSYKINALKTLNRLKHHPKTNPASFYKSLVENTLTRSNPFLDPRFATTDFSSLVRLISQGKPYEAFQQLNLKGVGSKIKSLYIRDMVYLSGSENKLKGNDSLIFTQPIDIWIKLFINEISWPGINVDKKNESYRALAHHYADRWNDVERGLKIIEICKAAKVSPVIINQAIWLFSSRVVADTKHLKQLIKEGNPSSFQHEKGLVTEFFV